MGFRRKLRNVVATYWQPGMWYGVLVAVFAALLWYRLGKLTGGYSPDELATLQASASLRHILESPINAPFTLLAHAFSYIEGHGLFFMRATATLFGLLTITTFYWLVRHWHGQRSAILGTIIFGSSAWFLHTARFGGPEILLFLLLALVACGAWLKQTSSRLVLLVCFVLATLLLYIPGMIWFVAVGVLWEWRTIDRIFKEHLGVVTIGAAAMLVILAPLGWAIYKSPALAKVVVGLPAEGWPQPLTMLHNLADIPLSLFFTTPANPQHWLAHLPVLAAFSMAMLVLGAYVYIHHWRLKRSKLLGGAVLIGALLIGLGGAVTLSIIIPAIYILVAAGVGLLLDRWYKVFPRNTIAQGVGIGLVTLAVVVTCWYNLRRYFVAWPAAPATRQVFVVKQTP